LAIEAGLPVVQPEKIKNNPELRSRLEGRELRLNNRVRAVYE